MSDNYFSQLSVSAGMTGQWHLSSPLLLENIFSGILLNFLGRCQQYITVDDMELPPAKTVCESAFRQT